MNWKERQLNRYGVPRVSFVSVKEIIISVCYHLYSDTVYQQYLVHPNQTMHRSLCRRTTLPSDWIKPLHLNPRPTILYVNFVNTVQLKDFLITYPEIVLMSNYLLSAYSLLTVMLAGDWSSLHFPMHQGHISAWYTISFTTTLHCWKSVDNTISNIKVNEIP